MNDNKEKGKILYWILATIGLAIGLGIIVGAIIGKSLL